MSDPYVLVVDDDPDMVGIIEAVLDSEGYACRGAENGLQALEAADAARPALVLLDMMMPIMNGWDCAYELRARFGKTLPIVVLTAAEHADAWGAEVEADGVLAKPFDVATLLHVVGNYVKPNGVPPQL